MALDDGSSRFELFSLLHAARECFAERLCEPAPYRFDLRRLPEKPLHRCDTSVHNAAGDDALEPREVDADVEGEAVRRDPAPGCAAYSADANANSSDLLVAHPYARQAALGRAFDAIAADRAHDEIGRASCRERVFRTV